MMKTIPLNSCPNPTCQRTFENLIIVKDNSKQPAETFYACPYCLTRLDPTATQVLKKQEPTYQNYTETTPITPVKIEQPTTNETPNNCPFYYGYLSIHYKDTIIPQQCLNCKKMLDCTLKETEEHHN